MVSPSHQLIAFDLGGVLFDIDVRRYLVRAGKSLGVSAEAVAMATFESGVWTQAEVGALSAEGFPSAVLRQLGKEPEPAAVEALSAAWCSIPQLRPGVVPLLERLRVRACAWSNTDYLHARLLKAAGGLGRRLTPVVTSCEIGAEKPSPVFFQAALEQVRVAPHRVAYVDDRPDNIAAARALGVDGYIATSLAGVISGLAARGLMKS